MPLMKLDVSRVGEPASSTSGSRAQELGEEQAHLQPAEVCAQTQVRALAERHVVVRLAGDVEPERVGERALVEVRRDVVDTTLSKA
jgi:hypothetical protein